MPLAKLKKYEAKFPLRYNVCLPFFTAVICMVTFSCNSLSDSVIHTQKNMPQAVLDDNIHKNRTVEQVIAACKEKAAERFAQALKKKGLSFPPKNLQLVAFKEERKLEIYTDKKWLHTYDFTAYSGKRGPKQKEGDRQIPEGIYGIEYLNPNSAYHVSIKITYPNARDKERAAQAGIDNPGSDIFIHGKQVSIGCIPIGDAYIEELFTLVALTGIENVRVAIFPNDARKNGKFLPCEVCPADTQELYTALKKELEKYEQERF